MREYFYLLFGRLLHLLLTQMLEMRLVLLRDHQQVLRVGGLLGAGRA